jgi:glyoxylase-like metal-dependent hydrolase (beta-lactamase superfamily II)
VIAPREPTRRQILKTAVAGTAALVLGGTVRRLSAAQAQAVATASPALRLADDLFVITLPGQSNVIANVTADGVVLVDGAGPGAADALMKAVATLPRGGRVHTIFNTHWHPEQTGSNESLGQAGATIIAHENTRLWLTTNVVYPWNGQTFTHLPKVAQPNKTFYTKGKLDSGVEYGYIPDAAHTDGDLYVFFPQQNVLAVGGAVSGQGWPAVDYITGGWIGGIVGGLQRLETIAYSERRIVPANGAVLSLADLKTQYQMYGTIYDRLVTLLNKGRGPSEAVEAKPTKEFDAKMGNPDEFVRRAFESLWGYLSPDA